MAWRTQTTTGGVQLNILPPHNSVQHIYDEWHTHTYTHTYTHTHIYIYIYIYI